MKKMNTKKMLSEAVVLLIAAVLIVSSTAVVANTNDTTLAITTVEKNFLESAGPLSAEEIYLKYYDDATAGTTAIGLQGGAPPYNWKTGIRFTQDELGTVTGDLVGVDVLEAGDFEYDGFVEIYEGDTPNRPGDLITSEPYSFDEAGWHRVDLTTPVTVDDYDEIWVVITWETGDNDFVPTLDDVPAVRGKGDFIYMNNVWQELYPSGPDFDHNWAMGAYIEGESSGTTLGITAPAGPIGVTSGIQNTGDSPAENVVYDYSITGGILGNVNVSDDGSVAELGVGAEEAISSGIFFGFGSIDIVINANADNAEAVSVSKSGFLLGFLVLGIS